MLLSYHRVFVVILIAAAVSGGCKRTANRFEGPKVDGFTGRLTHNGKPVSFPEGETVQLSVHHEKSTGPAVEHQYSVGWNLQDGRRDADWQVYRDAIPK